MKKLIILLCLMFSFSFLFAQADEGSTESAPAAEAEVDTEETPYPNAAGNSGAENADASTGESGASRFWTTVKNIFFFIIVLVIMFLLFRVMKKLSGGGLVSGDMIEVVTTRQLAGSRYLHVVKLGKDYMLISSTDGGVELLKDLDDKELIDQLQMHKEKNAEPDNRNFRDVLGDIIRPGQKMLSGGGKMKESLKNLKNQSDRLKKM